MVTKDIMMPTKKNFARVEKLAEEACQQLIRDNIDCCANFGDLHCADVAYCVDKNGDNWWRICIQEVSPSDSALKEYIYNYLKSAGLKRFTIEAEW
jgi:hypothetical protein